MWEEDQVIPSGQGTSQKDSTTLEGSSRGWRARPQVALRVMLRSADVKEGRGSEAGKEGKKINGLGRSINGK